MAELAIKGSLKVSRIREQKRDGLLRSPTLTEVSSGYGEVEIGPEPNL